MSSSRVAAAFSTGAVYSTSCRSSSAAQSTGNSAEMPKACCRNPLRACSRADGNWWLTLVGVRAADRQAVRPDSAHWRGGLWRRVLLRGRRAGAAARHRRGHVRPEAVRGAPSDFTLWAFLMLSRSTGFWTDLGRAAGLAAGEHGHPQGGVRGLSEGDRAALHERDLQPVHTQLQQFLQRAGTVPARRGDSLPHRRHAAGQ